MKNLPVDAIDQDLVDKIIRYTKLWIAGKVPNQPIREDITTLKPELGDPRSRRPSSTWQALKSFY